MSRQVIIGLCIVMAFWMGFAIAASLGDEEGMMQNSTQSCLRHTLPDKLKPHYDMCLEKGSEEMPNEEELLLCVLKAEGMVSDSDGETPIQFQIPEPEVESTEPEEELDHLTQATKECLEKDGMAEAEAMVQCVLEELHVRCTAMPEEGRMSESDEEPAAEN